MAAGRGRPCSNFRNPHTSSMSRQFTKELSMAKKNTETRRPGCRCGVTCQCGSGCTCARS
jgi:hypothetical protein